MALKDLKGIVPMWTLAVVGAAIQLSAWRALFKTLLAYAYAARVPVAFVMFLATQGGWDSQYSALTLPTSKMNGLTQYVLFGFLPQLVWWVAFTIIVGSLSGSIAAAIATRAKAAPQAALQS